MAVKYVIDKEKSEDEIILVVPSDHKIKDVEKFKKSIGDGEKLAEQGYLVTFGVKPSYAETGFGYIKIDDKLDLGYKVKSFVEKPDDKTAKEYFSKSEYYWNSGIFMFKVSTFMKELKEYASNIYSVINKIDFNETDNVPYNEFEKLPYISFDYAVLEHSKNIAMAELKSDWLDVGSWKSIYDVSKKDIDGNVKVCHILDMGSKNSLMYSSSKLVATVGLEDTVIVETEDAILACKKDKVQDV